MGDAIRHRGTGNIIVTNGGQFWLQNSTNTAPLYLADRGFVETAGALGALRMEGGALVRGPIYITADTRIHAFSGDNTINGPMIGSNTVERMGTGSLQLGNVTNFGFTGKWVVGSNGMLRVAADGALGALPSAPVADYITLTNRARLMNFNNELILHPNRGILIPGGTDSGGGIQAGWWAGVQVYGVISGAGGLYIQSDPTPGWVVLGGANTFQGGLTNDSRLRLGANEVIPDGASAGNVVLQPQTTYPVSSLASPRAFDLAGYSETINGLFGGGVITNSAGAGALFVGGNNASGVYTGRVAAGEGTSLRITKIGAGLQSMMGGFSGNVTLHSVGGGILVATGSVAGAGAVGAALSAGDLAAAGVLSTPGLMAFTNGAVLFNPGGASPGVDADLFAAHDLVLDTAVFAFITPLRTLGAGAVPMFSYTNSLTGSAALLTLVPTNTRYTAFTADDTTPGVITISAAGGAPNALTWVGTNGTWNVGAHASFYNETVASTDVFWQADTVRFGNVVAASDRTRTGTVTIVGAVAPERIIVEGVSNITFAGTGKITGWAELFKGGTNVLTVNTTNDFNGPVTVTGGMLRVGHASALGSIVGATWVTNGGTIDVNAQNLGAELFYLSGAGVANTGVVVNSSGSDALNAMQRVYLVGDSVFGGNRRWDIRSVGIFPTNDAFIAPLGGPVHLAFTGTAEKAWQNVTVGSGIDITVGQGLFRTEYNTIWQGPATNFIRVMAGATLDVYVQTNAVNRILTLDHGARLMAQMGGFTNLNVWVGPIQINGWATNETRAGQFLTLAGNITGSGNLTIISNGTTFFTGDNSAWAGNMFVATGTVDVGKGGTTGNLGTGSITNIGGRILFSRTDDYTIPNVFLSANAMTNPSIVKTGAGTLTLTGSGSTFNGMVVLQEGGLALGSDTALGVTNQLFIATPTTRLSSADGQTRVLGHYFWWHTDSGPNFVGSGEFVFTNAVFNGSLSKFLTVSNPAVAFTNTAPWIGTGPVTKYGPGDLRIYGTVASTAFTNMAGRLTLGLGGGFTNAAAVLAFYPGSVLDVAGVTGGWTLGAGQTLIGGMSVVGDATMLGRVRPGWPADTITFSNAATFNNATLEMELAKAGTVGGGVNDLLEIMGAATFSGVSTVHVAALNNEFAPRYALVTNIGARTGGAANLRLSVGIMTNSRYGFALNDSDPNAIWLDVSGANKTLDWRGTPVSGFWNVRGTTNSFLDGAMPETFWQADHVRFGAQAYSLMSTGRYAVTISEPTAPATLTIDGNRAYSFTNTIAGARITGGATVIKLGSAPVFMGAANDYAGPTLISNGLFVLTHSSGVGVSNSGTYIASGATLDVYGNMVGHIGYEEVFVAGEGVGGAGAIINRAGSQIQALRRVTLLGDTTVGGTGRWDVRNTNTVDGWLSTGGNPYNIVKTGTNQVTLVNTWVDPALGAIEIRNGVFGLESGTTGLGDPTKTVTVFNNAWLWLHNVSSPLSKGIVLREGGGILVNAGTIGAGQNYVLQPVVLSNGVSMVIGAGNALFAEFRGAGGLRKEGGGEIWLTGTNTFAGPFQMNAGTLRLMSNGTALAIAGLRMEGGTLVVDNSRGVNLPDRLPDSAPITGWGGTLRFDVATNAFSYERLGVVTAERGTLTIEQQIPVANGTISIVSLAGLQHVQGIINFSHSNVGSSPTFYFLGATATNEPGPHVIIDGLADGATIPFATVNGAGFARYSTTRGVYAPTYLAEFDGFSDQTGLDTRFTMQRELVTNWLSANRSVNTIVVSNQLSTFIDLRGYNLTLSGSGFRQIGSNNFAIVDTVGGGAVYAGEAIFHVASATTTVGVAMNLASLGKEGGGTLILLNPVTYTGKTSIGGVLQVGEMTAASIPTGQPVWNNGTLRFNTSVDHNFTANIIGTGGLDKFGTNTLTLSGASNLFGSSVNVYSGLLVFASGSMTVITGGTFGVGGTNVTGVGAAIVRIDPGATLELGPVATAMYGANFAANRPSIFYQDGGSFLIGITNLNTVRFAHWPGTNVYNMRDGLLVVSNRLTLAHDGWSFFNQTGGTVRAGQITFIRLDSVGWRTSQWNLVGGTLEIGKGGLHVHTSRTDAAGAQVGLNVYGGTLKAWDRDMETKIWENVPVRLFGNLTVTGGPGERVEVLGIVSGAGGIRKVGEGSMVLARTNTYSGGTILSNGTLTVKMRDALGTGPLRLVGGTLNLSLAGLYVQHLLGSFNQGDTPLSSVALGTYAGDFEQNVSSRMISEQATYGYQGFIINPGPTNVVYTFAENFDDNVRLRIIIGGVTNDILNNATWNVPTIGTIDLPPGIHRFDLRLGNAGSGAGGNATEWWTRWDLGFGWDPQGRGAPIMEFYQSLRAPEDGSLFIADTNGFSVPNSVFIDGNSTISLIGSRDIPMGLTGPLQIGSHTLVVTNNMAGLLTVGGTTTISGTPTIAVAPNVSMVISQSVTGGFTDGLTKDGAGRLVLRQPALYMGPTRVRAGALELTHLGALSSSIIQIDAGAQLVATGTSYTVEFGTGQTLRGSGTFVGGLIMDSGSTLAPGNSAGALTMVGDLSMEPGSTFQVDLNGLAPGTQYDQLLFSGGSWSLTLLNPELSVVLGFSPNIGDTFQIVSGFSSLSGTFDGLPTSGSTFVVGSTLFQIDYNTSDITLTVIPEPGSLGLMSMVAAAVLLRRRLRR